MLSFPQFFYATVKILLLQEASGGFPAAAAAAGRDGLDGTGHTSVLHMATVSFAPARKLALVEGVFSPCAGHIIHPDQTSTCTQKTRVSGTLSDFYSQT